MVTVRCVWRTAMRSHADQKLQARNWLSVMKFFGLLALISVRLLGQQESLTQEGGYWVHTMTSFPVIPPHSTLTVNARCSVIVKGSDNPASSFRVTQRVRAHSQAE